MPKQSNKIEAEELVSGLLRGDRRDLARAITLFESTNLDHRSHARKVLAGIMPKTGGALRVGISGSPGVGKSTFIEAFGPLLLAEFKRLAVLAIDPSSPISGGSILGDKTRMEMLSRDERVFIRPSPSGGSLGGVARHTRESILACEAAGYDAILVETVGVGQSEITVASMVDVFIALQLPNSGDELQGIKKGILELADLVVITKADGALTAAAKLTKSEHERALSLVRGLHMNAATGVPPVIAVSSVNGEGMKAVAAELHKIAVALKSSGQMQARRDKQALQWLHEEIAEGIRIKIFSEPKCAELIQSLESQIRAHSLTPSVAAEQIVDGFCFRRN